MTYDIAIARLGALKAALTLIRTARLECFGSDPAAWSFLHRVTRYLETEQQAAFAAAFQEVN